MTEDDREAQLEEIQSIEAIYGDLVHVDSTSRIIVKFDYDVQLTIDMPYDYPSTSAPTFEISAPLLSASQKNEISGRLQEEYLQNHGQPILYQWINVVIQYLANCSLDFNANQSSSSPDHILLEGPEYELQVPDVVVPDIVSGEVLMDRKSTFQAHLAAVKSKEEAMLVLNKLKENSKIARATHNMYAWTAEGEANGRRTRQHDCEDDGETGAGAKLLHLLEVMKATNVMVIVTRWYGGIHLGPDRFRHICNVAREILVQNGYSNRS